MPRVRAIPPDAEVALGARLNPILLKGAGTVKSLSAAFLADLEEDWKLHGREIFPILREKYPQVYFQGLVSLARILKLEVGALGAFDRPRSPEEVMDKLEERVGPEGRKLFEKFLEQVNKLQEQQEQQRTGSRTGAIERALAIAADTNAQTRSSSEEEQRAASSPSAGRS